jgi:hypothetical protein
MLLRDLYCCISKSQRNKRSVVGHSSWNVMEVFFWWGGGDFKGHGCIKCVVICHMPRSRGMVETHALRQLSHSDSFKLTFLRHFLVLDFLQPFCFSLYYAVIPFVLLLTILRYIIKMLPILRQTRTRFLNLPRASRIILASACTVFFLVCLFDNRNVRGFSQHVLDQHLVSLSPPTNCLAEE